MGMGIGFVLVRCGGMKERNESGEVAARRWGRGRRSAMGGARVWVVGCGWEFFFFVFFFSLFSVDRWLDGCWMDRWLDGWAPCHRSV